MFKCSYHVQLPPKKPQQCLYWQEEPAYGKKVQYAKDKDSVKSSAKRNWNRCKWSSEHFDILMPLITNNIQHSAPSWCNKATKQTRPSMCIRCSWTISPPSSWWDDWPCEWHVPCCWLWCYFLNESSASNRMEVHIFLLEDEHKKIENDAALAITEITTLVMSSYTEVELATTMCHSTEVHAFIPYAYWNETSINSHVYQSWRLNSCGHYMKSSDAKMPISILGTSGHPTLRIQVTIMLETHLWQIGLQKGHLGGKFNYFYKTTRDARMCRYLEKAHIPFPMCHSHKLCM